MKRNSAKTKDGSSTLYVPELDEHYHSIHGALQESQHVFIKAGYEECSKLDPLHILEVGFGTGLNALLTAQRSRNDQKEVWYTGIEKYPLSPDEVAQLNYADKEHRRETSLLNDLHRSIWEEFEKIQPYFHLKKIQVDLRQFSAIEEYDLIYFDAFAPSAQPHLWSTEVFEQMYRALKPKGLLTTYCVKGEIRRNMKAAGFDVEKIPGPPGKREMARAWKPIT